MKKALAMVVTMALLSGLLIMPTVHANGMITVWDEQFMTPYPYTMGQAVDVGYNTNQDATIMGKWYRPGSTCAVRYTTLETGFPIFPASGYTPSGHGNVQKLEFTDANAGNGISYRFPKIVSKTGSGKVTVEVGFYTDSLKLSGTLRTRVLIGNAGLLLNNGNLALTNPVGTATGSTTAGQILYSDSSVVLNTPGSWKASSQNWSTGWHKIKFELWESNPGTSGYDKASYYYDGASVASDVTIDPLTELTNLWLRHSIGTAGDAYYFDYITVTADDSEYNSSLSAPTKPEWNDDVIEWTDVQSDVAAYEVTLYKNSQKFKTYAVAPSVKTYNFTTQIATDTTATWQAAVKAMGVKDNTKLIGDSSDSILSDAWTAAVLPPNAPNNPIWNSSNTLSWSPASSGDVALSYSVELFKNGEATSVAKIDGIDATVFNFHDYMVVNGDGTYTAKVVGVNLGGAGTASELSDGNAFVLENNKNVTWVGDYEPPLAAGYNMHNTSAFVTTVRPQGYNAGKAYNNDRDVSGQYLEIWNKDSNNQNYFLKGYENFFNEEALSVKFKIYFKSTTNTADLFLSNGALIRLRFDKGNMTYAINNSASYVTLAKYQAGQWYDVEVRLFKDAVGNDKDYTRAEYYLDGIKLDTEANPTVNRNQSGFDRFMFNNNGTDETYSYFIDEIYISDFKGESLLQVGAPTNLACVDGVVVFEPEDGDNAVAYAVKLYKDGKLLSTETKLPSDVSGGVVTHDFSNFITLSGMGTYTVGVTAKGNYTTFRNSDEFFVDELGYDRYTITEPILSGTVAAGETVSVTATVTRNRLEGAFLPYALVIAAYDGNELLDISFSQLDSNQVSGLNDFQVLSGSVMIDPDAQNPVVKIFRWKDLIKLMPIEAVIEVHQN